MTLALAIKAVDAIIMAADSRGTIGDPRGLTAINDTQQKLFQFGRCGIVLAGASEMALAIIDEFGRQTLNNPTNVDDAVAAFGQAAIWCDHWYLSTPEQKCIGWPEQKYISDAGKKAPKLGAFFVRHQACVGLSAARSELAGRERRLL